MDGETKYDKNSTKGTTYLGTPKMRRQDELIAEHNVSIPDKLLDGTDYKILLNTAESKSFVLPFVTYIINLVY